MPQELLSKVGEYELKEKLGQGGYGAVYKARDSLGRDVAIKVLTAFGDDSNTIEGFRKEATTLAKLSHRNIVTVYQFGVDSGKPFLAMEYLQGQPLSALIKSRREMHLVEKLDIIIQATEGLKHAHENKVIHRDIKPHNLMVVENSIVKLIDFGIAQGDGSKSQSRQEIAGSLPYMSPEHFVQKRTPWCDIFSMGVVLYELLTGGHVPYASDRDDLPVAYHKLMSNEPPPPLSTYIQDLPPGLEEVVGKAISKQKLQGFETAEEFLFELARVQDTVKGDFVAELLKGLNEAAAKEDYGVAHDLVERILRVDPNNVAAKRKQFELKKFVQQHQRNEMLHTICMRVEEAINSKKFDLAQVGLDEAGKIDPASNTVKMLLQRLAERRELQSQIEALIFEAQRAGSSGNWDPAEKAVDQALQLEASNTRALEFREAIRRAVAQESRIVDQAQVALKELRFQEAFELIRQAEAIAPQSERVNALKDLAVNAYKEDERRREVAAAIQSAKEFASQNNFLAAREQLDQALAKYNDERSLLDLRAEIEKKREDLARQQFIEDKLKAGEQAFKAKSYVDAIAILEQAARRFPDPRLQDLLAKAKQKAQSQAAEKRRDQYLKSAKDSIAREDGASAVVTLEMAQTEFGAGDQDIAKLLEEAHRVAEVQAKVAAEKEEQARKEEERKAREAAERQEINTCVAGANASAQHGDFATGLKYIEQAATKFGMRPELAAAANQIRSARTTHATAQIQTIIDHANTEADTQRFSAALQLLERGKAFTEFASQTAVVRLTTSEEKIRKAAQEYETSATKIFQKAGANDAATVRQSEPTVVRPSGGAAAAAAPAPVRPAGSTRPSAKVSDTAVRRASQPVPAPPPSSNKGLIIAVVAVVVLVAAVGAYLFLSPSMADVRFEAEPAGTDVAINGQHCQAPCDLKLKPGHYSLKATHDNYNPLEQDLDVTTKTGTVPLKLAAFGTAVPLATGTLMLDFNVDNPDVFVDDQLKDNVAKGKSAKLTLAAGAHQVRIEKSGYQSMTKPIDVTRDAQASLSFSLTAGANAAPVQAYVIVTSVPNAKVFIDKQQVGTVQADKTFSGTVEPGKRHSLDISLDGYQTATKTFTAKEGDRVRETMMLTALKTSILSFSADTTEIQAGKSAVLKWETQGATEVSIDGLGTIPGASGSKSVSPTATTTYTLIASGPAGKSAAEKVTIKVNAAAAPPSVAAVAKPVIVNFDLGSDTIHEGEKVKLIWSTQNADSVTIDPEVGTVKGSGSVSVSPSKTTTYTLTAKGPGGEAKSSPQTLTVEAKASAPAAAAPITAAPTPTPSAGPTDAQLIKQVLEQKWPSAFASGNVGDLKAIFPNIPKNTLDAIRSARGMTLQLNCSPQVSGDNATAKCSQTAIFNGKSTPGSVMFSLSKSGGEWKIQSSK